MLAASFLARFPMLDDPQAEIVARQGASRGSLHFPFSYAEWESILIDLFEQSSQRLRDGPEPGTGVSPR